MSHFTHILSLTHYNYSWGKHAEKVVVKKKMDYSHAVWVKIALVQNAKTKILDAKVSASRKKYFDGL